MKLTHAILAQMTTAPTWKKPCNVTCYSVPPLTVDGTAGTDDDFVVHNENKQAERIRTVQDLIEFAFRAGYDTGERQARRSIRQALGVPEPE